MHGERLKLVALLSFYDERPEDLERLVNSLPLAGVSTLVALDGAYRLYEGGKPASPADQRLALAAACNRNGIHLDLHIPETVWQGNETEKRTRLFRLAEQHTSPDDWFLVVDGDESIKQVPEDLHRHLEQTPLHVGEVLFHEHLTPITVKRFPIPILFRAIRGIHVVGNHYTYRTPDGRNLWGSATHLRLEPRLLLHDVVVDHWTHHRAESRREASKAYYWKREVEKAELGRCAHYPECVRRATRVREDDWREVCSLHALDDVPQAA